MNVFAIFGGLTILAVASFVGYVAVLLFIQGGMTPIFGGVALSVVALMSLVIGFVLIGIGFAGIVARIRGGK